MIKKNLKALIISSVIILLPIIAGLLLWDQLPERFATHWGVDGQPDGWAGKPMAVFGIPLLMLVMQWVCALVTNADKRNHNQSAKAMNMVLWIIPAISIAAAAMIYGVAFGMEPNANMLLPILMGTMFLIVGNYLPKCKCNHTIGIKLVWTVYNEENWNATHRFGGKVWMGAGALILLCAFLPGNLPVIAFFLILLVAAVAPMVYSYLYYRKQRQAGLPEIKMPASSKWVTLVLIVLLTALFWWICSGSITVDYQDSCFVVDTDRFDDLTVAYDAVDSIEYREEMVSGSREWGFGSPTLLMGSFKNEEFGMYTRYTYAACDACVVLTSGEKVLVLNGADEAATKAIYEALKARIG